MSRFVPVALWFLASCATEEGTDTAAATGSDTETTSEPTTSTGATVDGCGATPPTLTAAADIATAAAVEGPAIQITVDATDPDGDLDLGHYMVWTDLVVDGAVETSGTPSTFAAFPPVPGDPAPCTTTTTFLIQWVLYADMGLSFATEYEFALQVEDAEGNLSEATIRSLCTLTEAGDPGGC